MLISVNLTLTKRGNPIVNYSPKILIYANQRFMEFVVGTFYKYLNSKCTTKIGNW